MIKSSRLIGSDNFCGVCSNLLNIKKFCSQITIIKENCCYWSRIICLFQTINSSFSVHFIFKIGTKKIEKYSVAKLKRDEENLKP